MTIMENGEIIEHVYCPTRGVDHYWRVFEFAPSLTLCDKVGLCTIKSDRPVDLYKVRKALRLKCIDHVMMDGDHATYTRANAYAARKLCHPADAAESVTYAAAVLGGDKLDSHERPIRKPSSGNLVHVCMPQGAAASQTES